MKLNEKCKYCDHQAAMIIEKVMVYGDGGTVRIPLCEHHVTISKAGVFGVKVPPSQSLYSKVKGVFGKIRALPFMISKVIRRYAAVDLKGLIFRKK